MYVTIRRTQKNNAREFNKFPSASFFISQRGTFFFKSRAIKKYRQIIKQKSRSLFLYFSIQIGRCMGTLYVKDFGFLKPSLLIYTTISIETKFFGKTLKERLIATTGEERTLSFAKELVSYILYSQCAIKSINALLGTKQM